MTLHAGAVRTAVGFHGVGLGRALLCGLALLVLMAPPAPAQRRGGILNTAMREDPTGFDQHGSKKSSSRTQEAMSLTHSRLFMYPEDDRKGGGVVGDLVERWSQPDANTYVLHLHQGVRFHPKPPVNGRELTAEDVRWTFSRVMKSPESRLFPTLKNVVAVDRHTVRFELSAPFGPFIPNLAATTIVIYAKDSGKPCDSCNGGRDLNGPETVIGTGAFMLEDYREGQLLVYKRHPDYFRKGKPYIDGVNIYVMRDKATYMSALRTGKVQLLEAWNRIDHVNAAEAADFPEIVIEVFPMFRTSENIVGRLDKKPWNDIRVRRAVSLAIDREQWVKGLYPKGGVRHSGPIPNVSEFYLAEKDLGDSAQWYRYDPAAAKRLLAEAGYPNGFKGKLYMSAGYGPDYTMRSALIKDMLGKVGIDLAIVAQEYPQWIKGTYAGNFPEWALLHVPTWGLGDEDEWLGSYIPGDTRNHIHLDDAKFVEIVARSRNAATLEERAESIREFQRLFHDQMLRVFLPIEEFVMLRKRNLMGYVPKMKGYDFGKRFENVWFE